MSLKIGIDFDNTIVNYDQVFPIVANKFGFLDENWKGTKAELKSEILKLPEGDICWQKIQGQVYGKFITHAELFHGLAEFLIFCKLRNVSVYIVSHKTEFGHFDEEKINLRDAAMHWMNVNGFFDERLFALKPENVSFWDRREQKVQRISDLECDVFIDDLLEVFEEPHFPQSCSKILFQNKNVSFNPDEKIKSCSSWKRIFDHLMSPVVEDEYLQLIQDQYPSFGFHSIQTIKGQGNSKVFLVKTAEQSLILKSYPDKTFDERDRLGNEYMALDYCNNNSLSVPKPILQNKLLNLGLFQHIEGRKPDLISEKEIERSLDFIESLITLSKEKKSVEIPMASEACLRGSDIERQIYLRLEKFRQITNQELNEFLKSFEDYFQTLSSHYKEFNVTYNQELGSENRILSPSDFGFHNSILSTNGTLYFIDFEYFGWDDPAKLISDFYWHPAMNLSIKLKSFWLDKSVQLFESDQQLVNRLDYFIPLIGLRWCMILLNEFLSEKLQNRVFAQLLTDEEVAKKQTSQLIKAKTLFEEVKKFQIQKEKVISIE